MKPFHILLTVALAASLVPLARAQDAGSSSVSLQIGNGTADLVQAQYAVGRVAYITAWPVGVIEPRLEISHMLTAHYALTASGALGWYREVDSPGPIASPPGNVDHATTLSAVSVRAGVDRVVKLGEGASFYFGPGLEWWSGKSKYESGNPTENSSSTTRYSVSTRLGGTMWINDAFGLTCNVGRRIGYASSQWQGARATWWPSSMSASGGAVFSFGRPLAQP